MAVGALELKFWQACCGVLQRPGLADKHWQLGQEVGGSEALQMIADLDALFAQRTQAEWSALFAHADCCVTPVLRTSEALAHPHFTQRGMAQRRRHETEGDYWAAAPPLRFSF
jgi:alpha-methylacyl-CoA racemase